MVFQSLPFDRLRANGLKNTTSTSAQDGAGRTDWKGALRRASFDKLRTGRADRLENMPYLRSC
ncbi:MAG: hypothetical protein LBD67_00190 [Candidatus Accumulibacter sp.]|nr:hypothetical protein [Accumulibacter sp.]